MIEKNPLSPKETLMLFNFATRLVAIESNVELVYERSLEALSVFAGNARVALYMKTEQGTVKLEGVFAEKKYRSIKNYITGSVGPLERVMAEKQYHIFSASPEFDFPFPATDPHPRGVRCLCLPMAAIGNDIMGVITIEGSAGGRWSLSDIQMFIVFSTVIAVSIENSRLYNLATIDSLTGLFVRNFFEIRLQEEIARLRRTPGSLSVFLADIDHFKEINDLYGHGDGDTVLKRVASIMGGAVRQGIDIPCRYGGDEFILLVIGANLEDSVKLAERVKRQCEAHPFTLGNDSRKVTLSGGLVFTASGSITDPKTIVDRADQMLYKAKNLGRNRICVWEGGG
jgi:two-component system, cell cycle response regulator